MTPIKKTTKGKIGKSVIKSKGEPNEKKTAEPDKKLFLEIHNHFFHAQVV